MPRCIALSQNTIVLFYVNRRNIWSSSLSLWEAVMTGGAANVEKRRKKSGHSKLG